MIGSPVKKRLITSALPYVNNAPHLGNIVGCVLSADVFARFCRSRGYETLYICGTDGYGTATETKAKQEGVTPREICERYHKIHTKVYEDFNISFDAFGKTFCDTHTEVVQNMYHSVLESGFLEEQETEQTFCISCDKFLADRFVEGVCPHCQYEDARGDQCESCGKLLNPTELLKPRCSICQETPVVKETKHLYLKLPELSQELETWHRSSDEKGQWTANARTTTRSWVEQGLKPRPITRDLKWGVEVPRPGYEHKVFYVWFDAPIGYISITKEAFPNDWQRWWHDPEETELYQYMGKDNIPFHSVIFPATKKASRQPWTMLHHLNATEYLNYEGTKFSKSKNIGIFGTDVAQLPFPADFWRFYLMRVRPEKQDSMFSWEDFRDRVNNELVDNVANLVNRVLVYYLKNFGEPIAKLDLAAGPSHEQDFIKEVRGYHEAGCKALEANELKEGLTQAMALGKAANRYFQEQEPWKKLKESKEEVGRIMNVLLYCVKDLAVMLHPFVPTTSEKILGWLGVTEVSWKSVGDFESLGGLVPQKPELLFKKIEDKQVDEYRQKFSGQGQSSFESIDIRVGKILSAKVHPNAESLYIEDIDLGDRTVQVVSGLAKYYPVEELPGRHVLVVANLKPAELRGVASEGMVLVAQTRKKLELIDVSDRQVGDRLTREGFDAAADQEIDIDTFNKFPMEVKDHQVVFKDQALVLGGEKVLTKELAKAKVK